MEKMLEKRKNPTGNNINFYPVISKSMVADISVSLACCVVASDNTTNLTVVFCLITS